MGNNLVFKQLARFVLPSPMMRSSARAGASRAWTLDRSLLPQPIGSEGGFVYWPGLIVATSTAPVSSSMMSPEFAADSMVPADVSI